MECDFWCGTELDEKVKRHRDILQEFFHCEWLQRRPREEGAWEVVAAHDPAVAPQPGLNPFSDRGRISEPSRFFDRTREIREVRQMLAAGNSISLVGEPEIGKSSLLYHLFVNREQWFSHTTVLFCDVQSMQDEQDFCADVLQGPGRPQADLKSLRRTLRGNKTILLIDEVQKLARPSFHSELHDLLRALAQEPTLTLAVTSHRPLREVFVPSGDSSPFHNIFTEKRLGPFTGEEVREFLQSRLKATGVSFSVDEMNSLEERSAGHPALLQRLAYDLFERKRGG